MLNVVQPKPLYGRRPESNQLEVIDEKPPQRSASTHQNQGRAVNGSNNQFQKLKNSETLEGINVKNYSLAMKEENGSSRVKFASGGGQQ